MNILLISDDLSRAEKLVECIGIVERTSIYELNGKSLVPDNSDVIILDLDDLSSKVIVRLRSVLSQARAGNTRVLFLYHGNSARAEAHGRILGADEIIPASTAPEALRLKVACLDETSPPALSGRAIVLAAESRQFFVQAFFSGTTITPEIATKSTLLIERAVKESTVGGWISAVQRFDNATHQHCLLVAGLSVAFAANLGFGPSESFKLTKSALLHDVGKTKIPLSILNKPGPLTPAEQLVMRTHASLGYDMLKDGGFSESTLRVVRSHHEMLDGSGYPDGLRTKQIPDLVRLVTICDIYGALIERRPYKSPVPATKAYSILESMTGRLDSDLVRAFQPVVASMA